MNKKDVYRLICFNTSFAALALALLFFSHLYLRNYGEHENRRVEVDKKFEQVFERVKSGSQQFSTDEWIKLIQQQRKAAEADHQAILPLLEFIQFAGWFGLIWVICGIFGILKVRNDIIKRQEKETP